ncbi:MAG: potassium/proton antiporter [Candidatus Nanopelagicales bacterium]
MDLDGLALALLASAAIVLLAVLGVRFAGLIGIPGLLLYLGLGLLLGWLFPALDVQDAQLATVLGYGALIVILAEGGLTTRSHDLRPVLWPALTLATIGVAVSIAVVAGALMLFTDVGLRVALLIGAVLAATDAAAVFSVLRRLRLHPRLRALLEAEAGFNDAPVVVLVVVLSAGTVDQSDAWQIPLIVIAELIGGIAFGVAVGLAARWALPRLALPSVGLYPIAVMSVMALAYGAAAVVHTSGFMAVYVAGVLVGSTEGLPHRRSVIGFAEGLAWAAQIGLFVMLGLLAQPEQAWSSIVPAAVAGVALVVLARPLAAVVSLAPLRLPARWIAFVSVAGLRGAVPIVFAAIPLGLGVPGASVVFDATLLLVVVLTVVQTPLLPWAGRRLGVDVGWKAQELQVEAAPMDRMDASLLGVDVDEESRISGLYVADLRLPKGASVSLVVRDGSGFVPDALTRFRPGDQLLIVTTEKARSAAVKRLRLVSKDGRLAGWRR